GVNLKVDLSTRFADWIETNLLKLDSSRVRSITFDGTKLDPDARRLIEGDIFTLQRKDGSSPWTIEGGVPEGKEVDTDKVSGLTTALSDLKIVGVRPKPPGLSEGLKSSASNEVKPSTRSEAVSLFNRGFYLTEDGRLYSNQGEVVLRTDEGAVYTLRY